MNPFEKPLPQVKIPSLPSPVPSRGGAAVRGNHPAGPLVPAQFLPGTAVRLPPPTPADCPQRPARRPFGPVGGGAVSERFLRRGAGESGRRGPVHRQPGEDGGPGRAGVSPGLRPFKRSGQRPGELRHPLSGGADRGGSPGDRRPAGPGRLPRLQALPRGKAPGLGGEPPWRF